MKGRDLYKYYKYFLILLSITFRVLPNFLVSFIWDIIKPLSGKLFVLIRYSILKSKSKNVGKNVYIGSNVTIRNMEKFVCGDNLSIHEFCVIYCDGGLTIGNDVSIAHRCSIITTNHGFEDKSKSIKYNPISSKGVIIKDDVWLGADVKILDGVIINERTVIAAGALVSKTFEENSLIGGIPAKLIKKI